MIEQVDTKLEQIDGFVHSICHCKIFRHYNFTKHLTSNRSVTSSLETYQLSCRSNWLIHNTISWGHVCALSWVRELRWSEHVMVKFNRYADTYTKRCSGLHTWSCVGKYASVLTNIDSVSFILPTRIYSRRSAPIYTQEWLVFFKDEKFLKAWIFLEVFYKYYRYRYKNYRKTK